MENLISKVSYISLEPFESLLIVVNLKQVVDHSDNIEQN